MPGIFLSHAVADRELAELLVDFLIEAIGVPPGKIFCSSLPGYGIPLTHDFNQEMREQITDPELVILLMTPSYMDSAFCLMELGATWAQGLKPLPIVVPPITFNDVTRTLGLRQGWDITDNAMLQGVKEAVIKALDIAGNDNWRFDKKRERWINELPGKLSDVAASPKVRRDELSRVEIERDQWKVTAEKSIAEGKKLNRNLQSLQKLRPVAMIIESEPLIALDLTQIFEKQGYIVAAVARTEKEAVDKAIHFKPDIITAEIPLADGSSGLSAVNRILTVCDAFPIFVTAFADRLLHAKRPEPAALVSKPFDPAVLSAVISEAHAHVLSNWDRELRMKDE